MRRVAAGLPLGRGTGQRPRTERAKSIGALVFTRRVAFLTALPRLLSLVAELAGRVVFLAVAIEFNGS